MTSEANEPRARRQRGDKSERGALVLGLLAPPQVPGEVVEDLAAELPALLSERVSDRVSWEVPTLRDTRVPDVEYGEEGYCWFIPIAASKHYLRIIFEPGSKGSCPPSSALGE